MPPVHPPRDLNRSSANRNIALEEAARLVSEGSVHVLDVRIAGPSSWLLENAERLPRGGRALDVACGSGRHALLLAAAGYSVRAVDRDAQKVEALRETAERLGLALEAKVVDLEAEVVDLGRQAFDLVVVVHYLHRPLFPALKRALRVGGLLLYETFTVDQAARGKPTNPAFLLHHGELPRLVSPLEVLHAREGDFEGRSVSGVVARRTRASG